MDFGWRVEIILSGVDCWTRNGKPTIEEEKYLLGKALKVVRTSCLSPYSLATAEFRSL